MIQSGRVQSGRGSRLLGIKPQENDSIWDRILVVGDVALRESGNGSQLLGIKPREKKESGKGSQLLGIKLKANLREDLSYT